MCEMRRWSTKTKPADPLAAAPQLPLNTDMDKSHLYLSGCVLLLALSWPPASGLPLGTERCAQCSQLFRDLLQNITGILDSELMCFGITSDKVVVKSTAETLPACAPTLTQSPGCMMQRNTPFSESECLRNIMKDLVYYEAVIQSYLRSTIRSPEGESALLSPALGIIKSLKNCSLMPREESDLSEEEVAQVWGGNSYSNRQEMCKMMRGFYVRTITINRAMGYISSGEHRK